MNEAEEGRIVNGEINKVLDRLYDAMYDAQGHPEIAFEVLRANVEETATKIQNMYEAEVKRIVNEKISEVLEGIYDALRYASAIVDTDIRFKVLRDNIDEINRRINNG
jgi:hypothetical protein